MKKLLSIVLVALLFCLSLSVGVVAQQPSERTVVDIEAEWNGEIAITLHHWFLNPLFTPDNVTLTLVFDNGEREILNDWNPNREALVRQHQPPEGDFRISYVPRYGWAPMVFYYETLAMWNDFWGYENPEDATWQQWDAYHSTLPQASIGFPNMSIFVSAYLSQRYPLPALTFRQAFTSTTQRPSIYSFTALQSGYHYILIRGVTPEYVLIDNRWGMFNEHSRSIRFPMREGQTMFFYIYAQPGHDYTITITDTFPSVWERLVESLPELLRMLIPLLLTIGLVGLIWWLAT